MAFDPAGAQLVYNDLLEIQELRAKRQAAKLAVGDSASTQLTDAERDTLRARWLDRINALRQEIKAEVATW